MGNLRRSHSQTRNSLHNRKYGRRVLGPTQNIEGVFGSTFWLIPARPPDRSNDVRVLLSTRHLRASSKRHTDIPVDLLVPLPNTGRKITYTTSVHFVVPAKALLPFVLPPALASKHDLPCQDARSMDIRLVNGPAADTSTILRRAVADSGRQAAEVVA